MSISKHARLSTNTEFYPSEIADSDSSVVYKEVPYIVLKATKDFQYANQVFEVQLENAEWLETKQDGDTLYIEDNTYVDGYTDENGNFVKAADPIEFLPGGESSSTGGSSTVGSVSETEAAYKTAVQNLIDAREAYETAQAGNTAYQTAAKALTDAQAAQTSAQTAVDTAEAELDALNATLEGMAARAEQEYQDAVSALLISGQTAPTDANGNAYFDDADTTKFYTTEDAIKAAFPTDEEYIAKLTTGDSAATDGQELVYLTLTADGAAALNDDGTQTQWGDPDDAYDGGAAGGTANEGDTLYYNGGTNTVSGTITLTDDDITEGFANGYIALTSDGSDLQSANQDEVTTKTEALTTVTEVEGAITGTTPTAAELLAAQKKVTDATADLAEKTTAVEDAQKALDAIDAPEIDAAATALAAAQATRKQAGLDMMQAIRNTGKGVDEAADQVVSAENGAFTSGDADYMADTDWEALYNGTAVAANVDIEVGSETLHIKVTKKTNSTIIVETDGYKLQKDDEIRLPLFVRTTGGVASVGSGVDDFWR